MNSTSGRLCLRGAGEGCDRVTGCRSTACERGGALRDVRESVARCHLAADDVELAARACDQLAAVGHAQNLLLLR